MKATIRICSIVFTLIIFSPLVIENAAADQANAKAKASAEAALQVARSWLSSIDAGDYAGSWSSSSTILKGVLSQEQWENTMSSLRKPLGTLVSRAVSSKQYRTTLPGAPDGEYVVIQFQTTFSTKTSALETVTPKKESDGKWRVAGYFIK